MQKPASGQKTAKPQFVLSGDALTIPPRTTKTVTALVDHSSEWNTTGTVKPLEKFAETGSLLVSHSMSAKIDKKVALGVTKTTERTYLIKKNTPIAQFSVVTPDQSKHMKPVDIEILSMIPEDDPDLNAYLNELLRRKKPEQQNNTFWIPTPKNPGKREDHTPIATRICRDVIEIKEKEKLNPQYGTESGTKLLERFDWTDTVQTEREKQTIEDILVDYHDFFARHSTDN